MLRRPLKYPIIKKKQSSTKCFHSFSLLSSLPVLTQTEVPTHTAPIHGKWRAISSYIMHASKSSAAQRSGRDESDTTTWNAVSKHLGDLKAVRLLGKSPQTSPRWELIFSLQAIVRAVCRLEFSSVSARPTDVISLRKSWSNNLSGLPSLCLLICPQGRTWWKQGYANAMWEIIQKLTPSVSFLTVSPLFPPCPLFCPVCLHAAHFMSTYPV